MKLFALLVLLTLCALASTANAGQGFSVVAGPSLWTFADPSSLGLFSPSVVSLPLGGNAVSGASSNTLDGFVVLGDTTVATYNVTHFSQVVNFGTDYLLGDVAFVPYSERVVAVGVTIGTFADSPTFFVSEDGGLTWGTPIAMSDSTTTSRPAAIAFASGVGIAAVGHNIYKSYDGKSWTSSYSNFARSISKVAVLDSSTLVATGVTLGVISNTPFAIHSQDAGNTWSELTLPTFSPAAAPVTGLALITAQSWLIATSGGEIWSTQDAAKTWNRSYVSANVSWTDLSYNSDWGVALAAGSYPLAPTTPGVLALYYGSPPWSVSSPLLNSGAAFSRVVPHVPSAAQSPSPSPSHQPSPSASPSISASPSAPASPTPSSVPSHSASPSTSVAASPTSSPSTGASHTPTPSASPSHSRAPTHTPAASPSQSPSPSTHSHTPTPSASPSKHTASPTPSASPSKHTASPSPSASPSKGSSRSPTPSPSTGSKKKDDSSSNKLALGLGLGLGLGGGLALLAAIGAVYFWRKNAAQRNLYQPINTDV